MRRSCRLLGCNDASLFAHCKEYSAARREIVHERAYLEDGNLRIAQKEADRAFELVEKIVELFDLRGKLSLPEATPPAHDSQGVGKRVELGSRKNKGRAGGISMKYILHSNAKKRAHFPVRTDLGYNEEVNLPAKGEPDIELTALQMKLLNLSSEYRHDEREGVYIVTEVDN